MQSDHQLILYLEEISAKHPLLRLAKGLAVAHIVYPIAERYEKRKVRSKCRELRQYYRLSMAQRRNISRNRLVETLHFAGNSVPYYKDLFRTINLDVAKVQRDLRYLSEIPFLTKDIIREQGERLLSKPLDQARYHDCKTGGSTGLSCHIYYDQPAADYAAGVTLYARERVGNRKHKSELHFACRFPGAKQRNKLGRGDLQCLAMNRSNIFFDRVDDEGLEQIWQTLNRRKPYMVHAHPSTLYALACYVERIYVTGSAFEVFESSGELLEPYMRETISRVLQCQVIDRYGLAELGVMAYELNGHEAGLQVLESEGWPESHPVDGGEHEELVFTGFRNRLMPLIRYRTGDLAQVESREDGFFLSNVMGRIHDLVPINGIVYATHYIQDVLDHRVGGIQEFQIDLRSTPPRLCIVLEPWADADKTIEKLRSYWDDAFAYCLVGHDDLVRVGSRAKFRHVVTA